MTWSLVTKQQNSYCDNKYNTKIVENHPKLLVFWWKFRRIRL